MVVRVRVLLRRWPRWDSRVVERVVERDLDRSPRDLFRLRLPALSWMSLSGVFSTSFFVSSASIRANIPCVTVSKWSVIFFCIFPIPLCCSSDVLLVSVSLLALLLVAACLVIVRLFCGVFCVFARTERGRPRLGVGVACLLVEGSCWLILMLVLFGIL